MTWLRVAILATILVGSFMLTGIDHIVARGLGVMSFYFIGFLVGAGPSGKARR